MSSFCNVCGMKRRRKRREQRVDNPPTAPPGILQRTRRDRERDRRYRLRYGITLFEYEAILAAQGGVCFLCGRPPKKVSHSLDHNHKGPQGIPSIRGILCGGRYPPGCNRKLGGIDNLAWLRRVIAYLEDPPAQKILKSFPR